MSTPAPHLFTLTGNLLAERTFHVADWTPGRTWRAQRETFQVGGKGINVSKMLIRLGVPNTALCFTGGSSGEQCAGWLRDRGFAFETFATTAPTRTGVVVRAPHVAETTFLGADAPPDPAAVRACATYLDRQDRGHVLALCGSFPGWNEPAFDPLREALTRWRTRGHLVADTYGPALQWLIGQPLDLLKINASELQTAVPSPIQPLAAGPRRYVITDGPAPLRYRDATGAEMSISPPAIREVSATGSGDVLLACLLEALVVRRKSLHDALVFALPYAAANAAHEGIAEFPNPP